MDSGPNVAIQGLCSPLEQDGPASECKNQDRSLLPGLPNDIALHCLIRVARRYHCVMAKVCKQWKETVCSAAFYNLRKDMGLTEGWIYSLTRDSSEVLHWYVLDPAGRKWKELPAMPGDYGRRYGMACEVLGRELFVVGGGKKYQHPTTDVLKYDPILNVWREAVSLETPRCYFVCAAFNGKLYAVGGMGSTSEILTSWEAYDSRGGCWSTFYDPNIVADIGESLVLNGKLYIRHICPINFPPTYAALYDPSQDSWALIDNEMTKQWCGPTGVVGNNIYMLDQTFGLKLMVLDQDSLNWNLVGRLSPKSVRTPCRIAVLGRNLYVVGTGLKTIVLNLDRAGNHEGMLVSSSIQGPENSVDVIMSCHVIEV